MKSAEEIMNMLEAFDLTGSLRDAGELAGVSHHTVARYVAARDSGVSSGRAAVRPQLIDEYLPKLEEWVDRSGGKVRADAAHFTALIASAAPSTPAKATSSHSSTAPAPQTDPQRRSTDASSTSAARPWAFAT